jgi:hypothetical protein
MATKPSRLASHAGKATKKTVKTGPTMARLVAEPDFLAVRGKSGDRFQDPRASCSANVRVVVSGRVVTAGH